MNNPSTYEHLGDRLSSAGEDTTLLFGDAVRKMQLALIESPNSLSQERAKFEKRIGTSVVLWTTQWKKWINQDLPNAYLLGVADTDITVSKLPASLVAIGTADDVRDVTNFFLNLNKTGVPKTVTKTIKAVGDIIIKNDGFLALNTVHAASAYAYQKEAYDLLKNTGLGIYRKANDVYREVAELTQNALFKEGNVLTRQMISNDMMKRFAEKGVDSIVYKNGARVGIDSYSEMVGRTMSSRVAQQGTFNRFVEKGYDLVRVTSHFGTCELCAPYQGKVFSLSGKSKKYPSLNSAIAGGLYHPNCLHDTSAYFPGQSKALETKVDPAEQKLIDEFGYDKAQRMTYDARQKQRGIERNIRKWKKEQAYSIDMNAEKFAHSKILDWQKAQRKHVTDNPFLKRQYDRESIRTVLKNQDIYNQAMDAKIKHLLSKIDTSNIPTSIAEKVAVKSVSVDITTKYGISTNYTGMAKEAQDRISVVIDDFITKNPSTGRMIKNVKIVSDSEAEHALAFYTSSDKTISLNESIFAGGTNKITSQHANAVRLNMAPKGTTWEHAIYHEQTHALCRTLVTKTGDVNIFNKIKRAVLKKNNLTAGQVGRNLSAYATTNTEEFVAEAFGEFYSSATPRQLSRDTVKMVQDMLK